MIVRFALMFFVGSQYLHTLPTAGNDVVLIVVLGAVGLGLGVLGGLPPMCVLVEAVSLLLASAGSQALSSSSGSAARMAFAFAIGHGFESAVSSFSIAHQIGATAWPVALGSMALIEPGARIAVVQVRGRRLVAA